MKIMVATRETQGDRANDFCHADEGVVVTFPAFECDGERPDDRCGCARSMMGIAGGATTTIKIVDAGEMDIAAFDMLILAHYRSNGWLSEDGKADDPEALAAVQGFARSLRSLAASFPVGMVLEKRGGHFQERVTAGPTELKAEMRPKIEAQVATKHPNATAATLRSFASQQRAKGKRARDPYKRTISTLTAEVLDEMALARA